MEAYGGSVGNQQAALAQARATGRAVPISGGNGWVAYPNGSVGQAGMTQSAITNAPIGSTVTWPSWANPHNWFQGGGTGGTAAAPSYTDPTTLQTFTAGPGTSITASGPGYGSGTVIPATMPTAPTYAPGVVDRHDAASAANASRVYRAQHGLSTAADNSADALNAESLAAAQAGRTYLNRDLAAQYGQTPAAGFVGPRTDVVNALSMPPTTTGQAVMLAPTTTQRANVGNNLLQQGIY